MASPEMKLNDQVVDQKDNWCHCPFTTVAVIILGLVILYYLLRRYAAGGRCDSKVRLDGKTVIVTGANCGIGLETARDMAQRGARVIIASRDPTKGEDAAQQVRSSTGNGNVVFYKLDLASLASIRKFAAEVLHQESHIDILINNAGVMMAPSDAKTEDGFELQIGTNHLGHFLLTNLLLDRIKKSNAARIVNVSSSGHKRARLNLNDINEVDGYRSFQIYGRSKLANILFTKELNRRLKGTKVTTYCLHPGGIRTNLTRHLTSVAQVAITLVGSLLFKTAVQGAQTSIYCAVQENIEHLSGKYFSDCQVKATNHPMAESEADAVKLWEVSEKLVGLTKTSHE